MWTNISFACQALRPLCADSTIAFHFGFVFEETSGWEITWINVTPSFLSTLKRKAIVFKFFRFEERFGKASLSWWIRMLGFQGAAFPVHVARGTDLACGTWHMPQSGVLHYYSQSYGDLIIFPLPRKKNTHLFRIPNIVGTFWVCLIVLQCTWKTLSDCTRPRTELGPLFGVTFNPRTRAPRKSSPPALWAE